MHLVVLRVRNFDLPNELPEKLQPYAPLIDFNNDAPINSKAQNEYSIVHASDPEEVGSPNQQSSRNAPTGESLVQFSLKPQIPSVCNLTIHSLKCFFFSIIKIYL